MTKLWTVTRVRAKKSAKKGGWFAQSYAVLAETAEGALKYVAERQPGLPAEFLAAHEAPYGIAVGRRESASEADVQRLKDTASAVLAEEAPSSEKQPSMAPQAVPPLWPVAADGRRLGSGQLVFVRALHARGSWHKGCGWNMHGGAFDTARMADSLLQRGLVRVTGHVYASVRHRGIPEGYMTEQTAVFALSETGAATLSSYMKSRGLPPLPPPSAGEQP